MSVDKTISPACMCTSCVGGCSSCSGGCSGGCSGSCSGDCRGCRGSCSGGCKGCSGTCSGSCSNTCTGTCIGTCTGQCNTACTAEAQAEEIANLGLNIAVGNPIRASDYTQLKAAIDREYTRRGKGLPAAFPVPPQPKGKVLLSTARKVLEDLYALDGLPEHDWRDSFSSGTVVPPSKWAPSIAYLKTLAAEIV